MWKNEIRVIVENAVYDDTECRAILWHSVEVDAALDMAAEVLAALPDDTENVERHAWMALCATLRDDRRRAYLETGALLLLMADAYARSHDWWPGRDAAAYAGCKEVIDFLASEGLTLHDLLDYADLWSVYRYMWGSTPRQYLCDMPRELSVFPESK